MSGIVVNGSHEDISVAAGADEIMNGDFDIITADTDVTLSVNGYDDTINANYATLTVNDAAGAGNTVNGSFNNITVPDQLSPHGERHGRDDQRRGHGYL